MRAQAARSRCCPMHDEKTVTLLQQTCPRALLLEQVMRRTDDETLLLVFVDVAPLSDAYLVALGRLLAANPGPIRAGTPLQVWAGSGTLQRRWRDACPPVRSSIWGELLTLRALFGSTVHVPVSTHGAHPDDETPLDPLAELQDLRSRL